MNNPMQPPVTPQTPQQPGMGAEAPPQQPPNLKFDSQTIARGMTSRKKAEETPGVFTNIGGASAGQGSAPLDKGTRMAGEGGNRALELMNNQEEAVRTDEWMTRFAKSNQGVEWNKAQTSGGLE